MVSTGAGPRHAKSTIASDCSAVGSPWLAASCAESTAIAFAPSAADAATAFRSPATVCGERGPQEG
eukprot:517395-Prorocentrum_minimum.AAC.1